MKIPRAALQQSSLQGSPAKSASAMRTILSVPTAAVILQTNDQCAAAAQFEEVPVVRFHFNNHRRWL